MYCAMCGAPVEAQGSAAPGEGEAATANAGQATAPVFAAAPATQPNAGSVTAIDGAKKKPVIVIAVVVVLLLIVVGIVVAMLLGKDPETPQDRAEQEAALNAAESVQYPTYYVVNCKESISLRETPDINEIAIAQIPFGAPVSVIEVGENGFYKVAYDGKTGYVPSSYLSTSRQEQSAQSAETPRTDMTYQTMYVVNCDEWITLRTAPSTSASEITKIPLGSSVSYVEPAENGFYKIVYLGQTGYALASYLSTTPPSAAKSPSSTVYYRVVNCDEWISLRKAPSTSADRYCTIPLGERVTYYSNAGNGFLEVGYDGYVGYALASYLTPA